ncbi:TauD/TfdA family dioxygenase [Bordetella genomosp. 13]|uniref:TauD/TfdA family dioxygenase n=1 Tax=Bordetella genomosp. 13 TaxID=463040 RepID=UPI0016434870|nr:TauD/TfdA family dioxygenase [Bordetella genomosp. 13]
MSEYQPVTDATAWTAEQLNNDQSWIYRFGPEAIAELNAALDKVRHIPITDIRKEDFPLDKVAVDLKKVAEQVEEGIGMAVLRGLPVFDYSKDDASRIYWGIGLHLGRPVTQNSRAHLLGHVKDEGVKYGHKTRGYNTSAKLNFHTDNTDVVGLLCLRVSKTGGFSRITSTTSIHNEILKRRPDLLRPLYEGFYYDLKGEHLPGRPPLTDHPIPVFSWFDGKLSCRYLRNAFEPAFEKRGTPATKEQVEAMDLFDELAGSKALCFEMAMEPGDMQLLNNHVIVHSRTAFEDYEEEDRKRHLLRLWLRTDYRPLAPEFAERFGPGTARMGVPTPEAFGLPPRPPLEHGLPEPAMGH